MHSSYARVYRVFCQCTPLTFCCSHSVDLSYYPNSPLSSPVSVLSLSLRVSEEEGREGEVEMGEEGIYRATCVIWFSVSRGGEQKADYVYR